MNLNIFEQQQKTDHTEDDFSANHVHEVRQKIENRKKRQKRIKMIFGGLIVLVLLLLCATAYSSYRLHTLAKEELTTSTPVTPKTAEDVVKALSRHILVPEGVPQIAEVQDAEKLRNSQAFFKDAENGDIVVVYDTTIFIYRPSKDIVVASGDISGVGQVKP